MRLPKPDDIANDIPIVIIGLLSSLGINSGFKAKTGEEAPAAKPIEIAGDTHGQPEARPACWIP